MIYRPKITGKPAGDVGLGALAVVVRFGYGMGIAPDDLGAGKEPDEAALERFAAFLAGAGPAEKRRPR